MMDSATLATVGAVSLMAALSPGPDFAVVTQSCITSGSFRGGSLAALGVSCALLVHIAYCVSGIALLLQESPLLFLCLKYLGASYLFYLGGSLIWEKVSCKKSLDYQLAEGGETAAIKQKSPFVSGFLCNLLNPKATLFILSLFTQFVRSDSSMIEKISIGGVFASIVLVWFLLLSYLITRRVAMEWMSRFQEAISVVMGVLLCFLALYVLLAR